MHNCRYVHDNSNHPNTPNTPGVDLEMFSGLLVMSNGSQYYLHKYLFAEKLVLKFSAVLITAGIRMLHGALLKFITSSSLMQPPHLCFSLHSSKHLPQQTCSITSWKRTSTDFRQIHYNDIVKITVIVGSC